MATFKIKNQISKIKNWIKDNPREFLILAIILLIGSFLRLYKIDQYMTFLGDEGRDVIVVRRLLVNFDPILIGPGTSIGNMYLGPLYYYLMAPALFLANYSPVGPAAQIALLGVATIFFVWWIGKEWFPSTRASTELSRKSSGQAGIAGLVAAGLYAVSPTVIVYSRSSWNPNIMPFFALLCIYSIWRVWQKHQYKWLIVLGISYAFVLQSHYLGLLLAPVLLLFWLLTLRNLKLFRNSKLKIRNFLQKSFFSFLIFAGLMSPLVIFDARHGWRNFSAIKTFFAVRQETVSLRPWKAIPKLWPTFEKINLRLLAGYNQPLGTLLSVSTVLFLAWIVFRYRKNYSLVPRAYQRSWPSSAYWLLFSWLGFALLGLGLYKQEIYDHYYGFFFPAPFLLLGGITSQIANIKYQKSNITKILLTFAICVLILVNLQSSPLKYPPNQQLRRAKEVAQKIAEESKGQRFNLAVIAERNYEDGYQYFLEKEGLPVVDIDAQVPSSVADQLFVVCEMPADKCDPTHSPKAEVANFGWSKIESQWEIFGTRIFKLVHTK